MGQKEGNLAEKYFPLKSFGLDLTSVSCGRCSCSRRVVLHYGIACTDMNRADLAWWTDQSDVQLEI